MWPWLWRHPSHRFHIAATALASEHREMQEKGAELLEMLLQGELQRGGDRHRKVPLAGPHLPAPVASFLAFASLPTLHRLGPGLLALVVASLWSMAVSSTGAEVVLVMPSARSHGHLRRRGVQPAWFAPCRSVGCAFPHA